MAAGQVSRYQFDMMITTALPRIHFGHDATKSRVRSYLAGLCIAAFVVRMAVYYQRPGILAPDEVFQYLEQAHRLVFHTGLVPWEYIVGIRNWLIPGAIAGIMEVARLVGDGPSVQVGAVALCMALLSLCTVNCAFRWGYNVGGIAAALIAGGLNAFWFEQVYYAVHPLADTIAASPLMSGLYLAYPGVSMPTRKRMFWAGVLFGVTLVVRIQLAPAIAVAALWCCRTEFRGRILPMTLGGIVPLCVLGIVDAFTWGFPFQSLWRYVQLNAEISGSFGTSPFYMFALLVVVFWSAFAVLIGVLAVIGMRSLPLIGVTAAVIGLTFSLVGHKEPRFIYPAIPLVLTLAGIGSAEAGAMIARRLKASMSPQSLGLGVAGLWIIVSIYLGGFGPFHSLWSAGTGVIAAFRVVDADPDACGVAVEPAVRWFESGGYVFLRPGIQLVGLRRDGDGAPTSRYNYVFNYQPLKQANGADFNGTDLGDVTADPVNCWLERDAPGQDVKVCLWHIRQGCVSGRSVPLVAIPPPFVVRFMTGSSGG
jgi:GPI mannosyltransferase 3